MVIKGGGYRALVQAQQSSPNEINGSNGNSSHNTANNGTKDDLNDKRASIFVPKEATSLLDRDNEIVLRDVHFHYPSRPESNIFRGVNLAVKKGETLALVGPSGHGEYTTIVSWFSFHLLLLLIPLHYL